MKTHKSIIMIIFSLLFILFKPSGIHAQVSVGVGITVYSAPPVLPVYAQPECPADGYFWTPGYWAYNGYDYYWVPGVWVRPPQYGYYWTPCWWGFSGGYYVYHAGYWGPHVGYYGGINYGYGYGGSGYYGGRYEGGRFRYNTAVVNVNRTVVRNTYEDRTVIVNNASANRASYNGQGGVTARPTSQERIAERENHINQTTEQTSHQQMAGRDRNQFASVNRGRPTTTAFNKAGGQAFDQKGQSAGVINSRPTNHPAGGQGNNQLNHSASPNRTVAHPNNQQLMQNKPAPRQNMQQQNQRRQPNQGREEHERK